MRVIQKQRAGQILAAIVLVLLSASTTFGQRARAASTALPPYVVIPATDVTESQPLLLRSVTLGKVADDRPGVVTDAIMVRGRIFVLEGMQRRLFVYDSSGALLRRGAEWGREDGSLMSPARLVAQRDTVLVLDVTHRNAVSAFDLDGQFLGARFPELHEASASSIALGNTVAAFAQMDANMRPGRTGVAIRDRQGKEIAAGCPSADAYQASEQRRGMIAHFVTRLVALQGNRIYCAQAITPVVTILDMTGATVGHIAIAPPFYVAPTDIGETRNQKAIVEFQSKWTALQTFAVTPTGFIAVYSRYDMRAGRFDYRSFSCNLPPAAKSCRVGLIPGIPLRVVSPDTLLTMVSELDGSVSLQVLRLER